MFFSVYIVFLIDLSYDSVGVEKRHLMKNKLVSTEEHNFMLSEFKNKKLWCEFFLIVLLSDAVMSPSNLYLLIGESD